MIHLVADSKNTAFLLVFSYGLCYNLSRRKVVDIMKRMVIPLKSEEKIVMLKLDIIFKRVFGNEKNTEIITGFISDMLDIPREKITKVVIKNIVER